MVIGDILNLVFRKKSLDITKIKKDSRVPSDSAGVQISCSYNLNSLLSRRYFIFKKTFKDNVGLNLQGSVKCSAHMFSL